MERPLPRAGGAASGALFVAAPSAWRAHAPIGVLHVASKAVTTARSAVSASRACPSVSARGRFPRRLVVGARLQHQAALPRCRHQLA